jgi:hypothetical protein
MTDVNNPLIKAYIDRLEALGLLTYEGEEPSDEPAPLYVVVSSPSGFSISTQATGDIRATIQLSVHSWKLGYNSSMDANTAAGLIIANLKPRPTSVLDLSESGMDMNRLELTADQTEGPYELDGRKYISRRLTFEQDIFIFT